MIMLISEILEDQERSILSVMGKQPEHVEERFLCINKKLTSLKGAPSTVDSDFHCFNNKLTSLEGGPSMVDGDFLCFNNNLTSLQGAPSHIGKTLYCNNNNLTSLHNIHKHIKHIGGYADFDNNPIQSHVLGLLLIDGLTKVILKAKRGKVQNIINKHLQRGRDIFDCQEELIESGLEDFAQL